MLHYVTRNQHIDNPFIDSKPPGLIAIEPCLHGLYVGRGVGVTVLPIRIGAPPEVPIITLRCRVERTETKALVRERDQEQPLEPAGQPVR